MSKNGIFPACISWLWTDRKTYRAVLSRGSERLKSGFSTFILTVNLFRSLRAVMGTAHDHNAETLLAVMDTSAAQFAILAPTIRIQEERPLLLPLVAPAHKSRSGLRSF